MNVYDALPRARCLICGMSRRILIFAAMASSSSDVSCDGHEHVWCHDH